MWAAQLSGVSKRYGRRNALRDVELGVAPGTAVGLLGPNGAGKTTALRLLLGFVRPTRGEVRLRGVAPADPSSRLGVGYLPERLVLPARMRVDAFLRLHATLAGVEDGAIEAEIGRVLEQTGLADRADQRLGTLSKGLAQRAGFAQALLGPPELLVLDEPTSGLDPLGVREARGWIGASRARGCTIVLCSHVLSEVERSCDHLVILHEGRIAATGAVDTLLRPGESLEDAFVRVVGG